VRHAKLCELREPEPRPALTRPGAARSSVQFVGANGWFTDGVDAPDLQEAKSLLDTVRHR
jgi:hypothetical protein